MRKLLFIGVGLFLLSYMGWAQTSNLSEDSEGFEGRNLKSLHASADWYMMMQSASPNLFSVEKAYAEYFKNHPFTKSKETRAFEFWKRHIVRDNYNEQGEVGKQIVNYNDLKLNQTLKKKARSVSLVDSWVRVPIKPDMLPSWQSGSYTQGTCNMLAIHPIDTTQMIAAFIDGGTLWRTTDNCQTWTQCATNLLVRHFGSVVYAPSNPLIVYAGSSQGVIKSTDGGASWSMTGYDQRASYPGGNEIWAMEVKSDNPNYVLFAIGGTLYRSTDGGASWTSASLGNSIRDIRALPGNSNTVFATVKTSTWATLMRSTDFGITWTSITNGYPVSVDGYTGELAMVAVTPAEPNSVWVELIAKETSTSTTKTYGIYKSTDAGVTFTKTAITQDLTDNFWQGGWNQALAISSTNPSIIAGGAYSTFVSVDGGTTWNIDGSMGKTGPHSDVHGIVIRGTTVWVVGDGGVTKTYNYGKSGTYLHNVDDGIQSHCLWGFDQAWKSDVMAVGMYHGPTTLRDDDIYVGWYPGPGADAGSSFVNKGDDRYIYAAPWGLTRITRSTSRLTPPTTSSISYISAGKGDMSDPDYYQKIYGSNSNKVMISTSNGASFDNSFSFDANVSDYVVALTNNKIIYARSGNVLKKTVDGGSVWTDVSPSLIRAGQNISSIAVDGENPLVVWVAFGGKQSTIKVGKSTDGGLTWTDYSATGLPSYGINCMVQQMGTNGGIYLGTDAGVYYRDNSLSSWVSYNTDLPLATHVGWIKINYAKAKIRIAGQTGIWESNLYSQSLPVAHPTTASFEAQIGKSVQFSDMSVALASAAYSWTFPDGTPSTSTIEKPTVIYATGGDKNVTLTVTDVNGTNTRTYSNFVRIRSVGEVAKTGWSIKYYDSQQNATDQAASLTIDGNTSSFWHTAWSGSPAYPHEVQIDMGVTYAIESFRYLPRQDGGSNGTVKGYEWYVSTDGTNWGTAVATGTYATNTQEKIVTLSTPVTARYIRFRALSEINSQAFASAAEIGINGSTSVISSFVADKTLIAPSASVVFTDKSAGNPTSWLWTFPGGTPSTSTLQNPTVIYSNAGIYPVTLQVTSASGTDIVTKNSYITVTPYVPQTGWSVLYYDSQQDASGNAAVNAIDGNTSTMWHTQWSPTSIVCPHEIQIDMGTNYLVNGFVYVPRQDLANGRIANYEFYISSDALTWTLTNSGTWVNDATEKSISFPIASARYFKLVALSEVNGNAWSSAAELKMKLAIGYPPVADFNASATAINTGQSVIFSDLSSNTPTTWNWTFTGGSPATSTAQNPTVTYSTAGTYNVVLTSTNVAGSGTKTKTGYVTVAAAPTYCSVQSTSYTNDYIASVTIGSFTKTSTGSTYSNYTSSIVPLSLGTSTSYTLTPKGTARTEYWRVYIDYNHNGLFTDAGELVVDVNGKTSKTGSFTVPSDVVTGQTRMRVIQKYSSAITGPCTSFTNGEVEDYTVEISGYKPVLTSTENTAASKVVIYSCANEIKVTLEEQQQATVLIYDALGRLVQSQLIEGVVNSLAMRSRGVYIVKVLVGNEVIARKVFVD